MTELDRLIERADQSVEGLNANEALWNARNALQAEHGQAIAYEFVADKPWATLMKDRMPKLRAYLDSKGESGPPGPYVLISVWVGETLHIFNGPEFWRAVADIQGVAPSLLDKQLRYPIDPDSVPLGLPAPVDE